LIHTKVHNQLLYKKLHKLVYINYNIRICLRQDSLYKREEDSFDKLIELSLYDSQNPIQNWMEHGRSNEYPLLDEEDTQSDTPIPSRIATEDDDSRTLQRITCKSSLIDWTDEIVGDTHIGKHKQKTMIKKGKGKKQKRVFGSDEETPSPGQSSKYQESNLSSSTTDSDNGGDGGSQYCIEPSGEGTQFTCEKHKLTMLHMCILYFHTSLIVHFFTMRGRLYSHHAGYRSWCTIISKDYHDRIP
jgi:hypothetical protein